MRPVPAALDASPACFLFTVDVIPLSMWLFQISNSNLNPGIFAVSTLVILLSVASVEGVPVRHADQEEARAMNEAAVGDAFRTCESLATALSAGETSSRELVDLYLPRLPELDGKLHAFVSVF